MPETRGRRPVLDEETPAVMGEHPLDEVLAETRIVQATVLLDGEEGEPVGEHAREHAPADALGGTALAVDPHAEEPARRRALLEDVAVEPLRGELVESLVAPRPHLVGVIDRAVAAHEPRVLDVTDQPDRRPGDGHPDLDLRAHGDPCHPAAEGLDQEPVPAVAPRGTHVLAEQT